MSPTTLQLQRLMSRSSSGIYPMVTSSTTTLFHTNYPSSAFHISIPRVSCPPRFPLHTDSQCTTVFNSQLAAKQPYTIGIELTDGRIFTPTPNFTGPVDIVLGQHDYPFCLGACDSKVAAATIPLMYPAASSKSQTYIVPNSGHCINAHYSAQQAFDHINGFLSVNGIGCT